MTVETINFSLSVSLTAYIPDISDEMSNMKIKPAVIVIPGGSYRFCSDREAEPVALAYTAKGFNAFVLRYSLNEDAAFPTPLNDAEKALQTVIDNAEKWHTDTQKIAVCGFSAGGHLAAALCTMGCVKPSACILGYPCILDSTGPVLAKPVPSLDDKVTDKTPPTFIISAADDKTVPIENSLRYAKALDANNVPFEMHIYMNGGHGFSLATQTVFSDCEGLKKCQPASYWLQRSCEWLEEVFN